MKFYGVLNFLKPYLTTFTNRIISGMGFGIGMGIAWDLQSKSKN